MSARIIVADARAGLAQVPAESVQCVVTSPPYWGLRDYGLPAQVWGGDPACAHSWATSELETVDGAGNWTQGQNGEGRGRFAGDVDAARASGAARTSTVGDCSRCGAWLGQLGLEPTLGRYLEHVIEVFRVVRRVLRRDGTLWLNLGDCYLTWPRGNTGDAPRATDRPGANSEASSANRRRQRGLKRKDRVGLPHRVAFALQDDGWWWRDEIVWEKSNPQPESAGDRCTQSHEFLFMFSRRPRYYYDQDAIREPSVTAQPDAQVSGWDRSAGAHDVLEHNRGSKANRRARSRPERRAMAGRAGDGVRKSDLQDPDNKAPRLIENTARARAAGGRHDSPFGETRNRRSVWKIATHAYREAHFATFPPELVRPCILAGSRRGDTVLDPFAGAGTVGLVADRLGRDFVGVELSPEYAQLAERRILGDSPLFATVDVDEPL